MADARLEVPERNRCLGNGSGSQREIDVWGMAWGPREREREKCMGTV